MKPGGKRLNWSRGGGEQSQGHGAQQCNGGLEVEQVQPLRLMKSVSVHQHVLVLVWLCLGS